MQHRRGAHAGADVCWTSSKITEALIVSEIEFAFERTVDLIDELERAFQLQPRANRLHPQMVLFVDHDAERLATIHDNRAADTFGGVLATDEMSLDEHLFLHGRKILQQLRKRILHLD